MKTSPHREPGTASQATTRNRQSYKFASGFALISVLTILTLLMVLVLALSSVLHVETRASATGKDHLIARQNAVLGLETALSQLQQYAGKDQAVTFPATTFYPTKDVNLPLATQTPGKGELFDSPSFGYRTFAQTSSARTYLDKSNTYLTPSEREQWEQALRNYWNGGSTGTLNPRWTGIMDASLRVDRATDPAANPTSLPAQRYEEDPNTKYGEPKRAQLPVWLVSGNEQFLIDQETDTSYPDGYFTPDAPIPDPTDSNRTVWLVGEGSSGNASDSVDGLDGRVKVEKQEIRVPIGGTERVNGHYAYWVGDESTKANFAVRDPFFNETQGTPNYRNRLQVPQRIGWENISTGNVDETFRNIATFGVNDEKIANISTSRDIALLENTNPEDVADAAKNNFHNLTAFSRSLLTDTSLGGLKRDLTVFMERAAGLTFGGTIPDPTRYDARDPRFRAWGAANNGFPLSLLNLPTWGQLRAWYQNEELGGSITPSADAAPVLTSFLLHGAWSYNPATRTVRLHWYPLVMLWNPYDSSLRSATYDLEIGISPHTSQTFIVNDSPTLAELQVDVDADWREVTVPPLSTALDPNGQEVLLHSNASTPPSRYENPSEDTPQVIRIFKGQWGRPGQPLFNGTDGNYRYFVQLTETGDAIDTVNMEMGPWPFDATRTDGTTDAFGRYYYRATAANANIGLRTEGGESVQAPDAGNRWYAGALGRKGISVRVCPHRTDVPINSTFEGHFPVQHPFRFRIFDSFAPGEVKVFSIPVSTQWNKMSEIPLANHYEADRPKSFWFDVLSLAHGPTTTPSGLKFFTNQLGGIYAPTVRFSINGNLIFSAETGLGTATFNEVLNSMLGQAYVDKNKNSLNTNDSRDDLNRPITNINEAAPKFVSSWRPLRSFSDVETGNNFMSQDVENRLSSNWAYGLIWVEPLSSSSGVEGNIALDEYQPVFSRFNIGARDWQLHPLVDAKRDIYGANNVWGRGGAPLRMEFLTRLKHVRSVQGLSVGQNWDTGQVDGATNRGFALVSRTALANNIRGLSILPIRNARRAQSEILSLGQFQQANLSNFYWQPAFPIGNSFAPPYTDREAIAGLNSRFIGGAVATLPGKVAADPLNQTIDLSYLLNENLWDRYFLSSIPQTGTLDSNQPLANSRHRFRAETDLQDPGQVSEIRDLDTAAAYLTNLGALNVNTTSVEAWKALLTAFRDLKIVGGTISPRENPDETVPVSRSLDPVQGVLEFTSETQNTAHMGAESANKNYERVVGGFRYLTDSMIDILARRIVDEVRMRGPFLSLADFINRRLVPPQGSNVEGSDWYEARTNGFVGVEGAPVVPYDPGLGVMAQFPPFSRSDQRPDFMNPTYDPFVGLQGLSGSLQRALQVSGINGGVNHPGGLASYRSVDQVFSIAVKNGGGADYFSGQTGIHYTNFSGEPQINNRSKHSIDPSFRHHLDLEHFASAPVGEAGQMFDGAPGFVTQGDLLAMIGPALTPRGDTFLIRSYGDAVDASGRVVSRAYLEAVVQRVPDPVTPAGSSGADKWRPTDSFGRQLRVVNFRWLNPDEI